MKRGFLLIASLAFLNFSGFAQKNDPVLMTVGGDNVSLSEFEAIFKKNNNNKPIDQAALDEYLDLFTKFKLKVKEARDLKMDTSLAFNSELNGYVKQLAMPYLKDKEAEDRLVKEAYDRLQKDVKIRHIIIRVSDCASPKDTLAAYTRIDKIRKELLKTRNFDEVARKYSEDSVSAKNGGLIGFYTALSLAYPFENAAYTLKPGETSGIVRTSFGYHIIKVEEVRPARGKVRVAHIFVRADKKDEAAYSLAKKRIQEAYDKIAAGEDFAAVCKTYSEDYNSSGKGGELAPFGINQMVQEYEDAAFGLQNPGDITKPFETHLGFHIIKLVEKQPIPKFDDMKGELAKMVAKNKRSELTRNVFINRLKKDYGFEENKAMMAALETEAAKNGGSVSRDYLSKIDGWMFRIKGTDYPAKDFISGVISKLPADKPVDLCMLKKTSYNPYVAQKLTEYKEGNLGSEYPEFKALVNEYRDGILLFNLMDKKVWSKSVKDSSGLQIYYDQNKNNYMWGERVHGYIIDVKDAKAEAEARKLVPKLASGKMTREAFVSKMNKKIKDNVIVTEANYTKGDNALVDAVVGTTGIGATDSKDGKIRFAVVDRVVAPEPKTLKEAKGMVISDYQTYLETEWIRELQVKYPVTVNKPVLYSLISK